MKTEDCSENSGTRKTSLKISSEITSNLPESYLDSHEESSVGTDFWETYKKQFGLSSVNARLVATQSHLIFTKSFSFEPLDCLIRSLQLDGVFLVLIRNTINFVLNFIKQKQQSSSSNLIELFCRETSTFPLAVQWKFILGFSETVPCNKF